jgi:UPF0755 protein
MTRLKIIFVSLSVLAFAGLAFVVIGSTPPGNFPQGITVSITKGTTISETAEELLNKGIIRSTLLFKAYVSLLSNVSGVKMGNYFFSSSQSALRIAYRMVMGQLGVPQIKVTIPEGLATPDIARAIKREIPTFDDKGFLKLARPLEGYLFPDTYFFDRNTKPEDVIAAMHDNFESHTSDIRVPRSLAGKTFKDVIIMASLVEEEATSSSDRRMIAGILWKRIAAGMPLQVDAPFFYILGKSSDQLTYGDLATTSAYNLYKHTGLPPTPIDNPGLGSIVDTVNPTETKYWFFLSGGDGRVHFAETLDGHIANREKYLN